MKKIAKFIKQYQLINSKAKLTNYIVNIYDITQFRIAFRLAQCRAFRQDVHDLLEMCKPDKYCIDAYALTIAAMSEKL